MPTNRNFCGITVMLLVSTTAGCVENMNALDPLMATSLEAASSTTLSAVAGTSVGRPSVIVRDQNGSPMKGVTVQFHRLIGDGAFTEGEFVTDDSGRATAGEWILAKVAGLNVVVAGSGSLKIDFSANGVSGKPVKILKISGDQQFGHAGSPTPFPQTVFIGDAYDNAVRGVVIAFAVTNGGGSVGGPADVVSDANGLAVFSGWALGAEGQQILSATIADVAPAVFTATISSDACNSLSTLSNGSTPLMLLSLFPCKTPDGGVANYYAYRVNEDGPYAFEAMTSDFDAVLTLMTKDGRPVAEATATYARNAAFDVLLMRGDYIVGVRPASPSEGGAYRLVVNGATGVVSNCVDMFITLGTTTAQTLAKGDCEMGRQYYSDHYRIYLAAGTKVHITMSSNAMDNMIDVASLSGGFIPLTYEQIASDGLAGTRVSFTAGTSGYYVISAYMDYENGPYVLTVKP